MRELASRVWANRWFRNVVGAGLLCFWSWDIGLQIRLSHEIGSIVLSIVEAGFIVYFGRQGVRSIWASRVLQKGLKSFLDRFPWFNRLLNPLKNLYRKRFPRKPPKSYLLGYRVWHADGSDLMSLAQDVHPGYWWIPGPNEAECHEQAGCDGVPGFKCMCGFWMRESLRGARSYRAFWNRFHRSDFAPLVIGAVMCWGKSVRHEKSWRTKYAMPIAILADRWCPSELAEQIALHYDIPLFTSAKEFKQFVRSYSERPSA